MHQPVCHEKKNSYKFTELTTNWRRRFALSHLGETTNRFIYNRQSDLYYTLFTSEDGVTVIATTGNHIDTRNGLIMLIPDYSMSFMI